MSNIIANILGSQSNSSSVIFRSLIDFKEYMDRVEAAGGSVISRDDTFTVMRFLLNSGQFENTKLLFLSNGGCLQRTDGVLKYYRTAYDMSNENNDLNGSSTASQQPRLVGGIAPNSKPAAANLNGEGRYFTHPTISFSAVDAWSYTVQINHFGSNKTFSSITADSSLKSRIFLKVGIAFKFYIENADGVQVSGIANGTNNIIGKRTVLTFVANGDGNLKIYKNGVYFETISIATKFNFSKFGTSNSDETAPVCYLTTKLQSGALTAQQVADEAALLRSLYPEIESVVIGTQTWASRNFEAVATPLGNVIPEMQAAAAVEKVNSFTSVGAGWINNGDGSYTATGTGTGNDLYLKESLGFTIPRKFYKITVKVDDRTTGSLLIYDGYSGANIYPITGNVQSNGRIATNGDFIYLYKSTSTANSTFLFALADSGFDGKISNISVQELGWSNATEIYDAVYAATSGTTAQKEYAALKEAAMWRYPNNDVNKGAWAGKLYNKYAKRLLALDMLSANFGYNLPSGNDVDELLAYVGNDTNKLKYTGLDYWNDDLGTNETGLTLLGTGVITPEGVYVGEKELTGFWTSDSDELPTTGLPIRLIKDV